MSSQGEITNKSPPSRTDKALARAMTPGSPTWVAETSSWRNVVLDCNIEATAVIPAFSRRLLAKHNSTRAAVGCPTRALRTGPALAVRALPWRSKTESWGHKSSRGKRRVNPSSSRPHPLTRTVVTLDACQPTITPHVNTHVTGHVTASNNLRQKIASRRITYVQPQLFTQLLQADGMPTLFNNLHTSSTCVDGSSYKMQFTVTSMKIGRGAESTYY
jgi:hypothetical protein